MENCTTLIVHICRLRFLNSVIEGTVLLSSAPTLNRLKWSWISWLEFMVALRARLPFSIWQDRFNQLWFIPPGCYEIRINYAWSEGRSENTEELCKNISMYWPGVHSCHRGWRTSTKSSCLRGGWWQAIWPSGSFASPLRYVDNPKSKTHKNHKGQMG